MKMHCEKEEEVIRARAEGLLADDGEPAPESGAALREHVAVCPVCQEALSLAKLFERDQHALWALAPLPEADLVWWKAQLRARREAVRRAEAPVVFAEKAAWVAGALSAAGLAAWQWPAIRGWLALLTSAPILGSHSQPLAALFVASLASTLVLAGVSLYLIWSEK
jgi:hypothetical protein